MRYYRVHCYFLTDRKSRWDGTYRTQEVTHAFSTEKEMWEHVRTCNAGHATYRDPDFEALKRKKKKD